MKKSIILTLGVFLTLSIHAQKADANKFFADSLVNEWNVRWETDDPEQVKEILSENVIEVSGPVRNISRDSVLLNFVAKRMPVISELKAVNEYCTVSDNMIYTAGPYTLKVKRDEESFFVAQGNFTFIWTRQNDNEFKIEFIHIESVPKN